MFSGKTRELLTRIDNSVYIPNVEYIIFKPSTDTRQRTVHTRFGKLEYECDIVTPDQYSSIIDKADDKIVVAFDEAQFFDSSIIDVVKHLVESDKYVIMSGLDLDFRGEPFGPMPQLLSLADEILKLASANCMYNGCGSEGTRTQRLINGKPASYNSPLVLIGDKEAYQARCLAHHDVPDRP